MLAGGREVQARDSKEGPLHEFVFSAASIWMIVLLAMTVLAMIRLRSTAAHIMALYTLTLVLVALLVLYAGTPRSPFFLDLALVLVLLGFVVTVAAARYYEARRISWWPSRYRTWRTRWWSWASW